MCQQIWKTQQWPKDYKTSVFIPILKKSNAKRMTKLPYNCTHLTHQQVQFISVLSLSHVRLFATPWNATQQASLSITHSQSLLKCMSIESAMLSSNLILCCPLLLLPPIPPSIRVFSNESTLSQEVAKVLEFQL